MRRVLVGCPVAERAWILPTWIEAVEAQRTPDLEVKLVFLYTESADNTLSIIEKTGADILGDPFLKSRDPSRIVSHMWGLPEYRYMANLRNNLVAFARRQDIDFFFSLDSDIVLPNDHAITDLVESVNGRVTAVAPLVDLSTDPDFTAWNYMLRDPTSGYFRVQPGTQDAWMERETNLQVDAIMAAMLLGQTMMVVQWKEHSQGEDLGWADDARSKGLSSNIELNTRVRCHHFMRPMDQMVLPLGE